MTPIARIFVGLVLLVLTIAPLPAAAEPAAPVAADGPAATFTVNSTADPGDGICNAANCTLREAIIAANANGASKDTIAFAIPGAGPHVITLAAALQSISQPVIIDGLTQAGASCGAWPLTLKIVLNGTGLGAGTTGLTLAASGIEVRGLVIQRFPSHGIVITGNNNSVSCSYVGLNAAGINDLGNGGIGVYINNGAANKIYTNVISGNGSFGVYVGGASANGNAIHTNRIGVNAAGTAALQNDEEGVLVVGAPNTAIGNLNEGLGNLISGNNGNGVAITGNSPGTVVSGNFIGTNASGAGAIPNSGMGVAVNSAGAVIGGEAARLRNVISGNASHGIMVDVAGVQVLNNYIGVNADATAKLGNGGYGIYVTGANAQLGKAGWGNVIGGNSQEGVFINGGNGAQVVGNLIGVGSGGSNLGNGFFGVHINNSSNVTVGGTTTARGNTIAFNAADGVYVFGDGATGNRIRSNRIYSNDGLGIDLGENGVTANDSGDGDAGPNGLQNFPILTAVSSDGSSFTQLKGSLNSLPAASYQIDVYSNSACDPSGYGEGRAWLGTFGVSTNGSGNASFSIVLPAGVAPGTPVTATATNSGGSTSEFSLCRAAQFAPPLKHVYLPLVSR